MRDPRADDGAVGELRCHRAPDGAGRVQEARWWVLIGAASVAGGYIKIRVLTRMIHRNKGGGNDEET